MERSFSRRERKVMGLSRSSYGGRIILRHCERSEAIQSATVETSLDCFVATLLAMTAVVAPSGTTRALRKLQNQRVNRERRASAGVDLLHGAVLLGAEHV